MNRAKFILNLLNKEDDIVQETPHHGDTSTSFDVDKIFSKRDCYESAPPSAAVSNLNKSPALLQPHSAPMVTNNDEDDLLSLEDLIQDQDIPAKKPCTILDTETVPTSSDSTAMKSDDLTSKGHLTQKNYDVPKSPFSIISGIEPLCSSPVPDFSGSNDSWTPDEKCRLKKKRRIVKTLKFSSDSSDNDDTENICIQRNKIKSKDNTRWKKSCPSKWKKNIAKANRHNCLPYQNKKGKTMTAKKPKESKCETKCRYLCSSKFTEDERVKLCEQYWKITNYVAQKHFLLQLIVSKPVKTWKVNTLRDKHRSSSNEFYFSKNDCKIRVCKQFFLKTLCISNGPVNEAIKYKNEFGNFEGKDGRGSRVPINKTSFDSEQKIIDHINSFPRLESHYCRKTTQRQYLESKLSIAKMYELYKEKLESNNDTPCSFYVYKRVFGTKFNLSFFTPKKDLCIICTRFVSAGQPEHLKEDYDAHITRKVEAQAAKELDKQRSIDDETYLMVTADMQSTLHIPVCGVGILYYTRKLNVQNYTIHTAKPPHVAYCITWNEINGKRGSVEIASAINWWVSQVPANVKEITIYSDTCAGQNRNQFITAFLVHLIQRPDLNLEVFEQKYLESGHTHMEVDSMHSAIEKEQRHTPVYSMIDWKSVMSRARSKRNRDSAPPYIVKELTYDEMFDVKALNENIISNTSKDKDGKKIMWLKIKCLRFERQCPGIIKFRYVHDGPYFEFDILQKPEKEVPRTRKSIRLHAEHGTGECSETRIHLIAQLKEITIPKAYTAPLPISEAKKKDLLNLCRKGIIPQELHTWYKSLPSSNDIVDRLLEPDVNEESGEP